MYINAKKFGDEEYSKVYDQKEYYAVDGSCEFQAHIEKEEKEDGRKEKHAKYIEALSLCVKPVNAPVVWSGRSRMM